MFRRTIYFAPEGEGAGGGSATTATATTAAPAVATDTAEPHWLKPRLEREAASARSSERAALLAEIGITDPAEAKRLVAEEQTRKDAAKSLEQRAIEAERARDAEKARVATLTGTVGAIAAERLSTLTEAQRAAVTAIAGDDAAAQLKTITALSPTWATAAPAVAAAAAPPAPPASGTAPPAAAPAAATTVSQVDHKSEYASLKKTNPHAASLYLNKHHAAIYPPS